MSESVDVCLLHKDEQLPERETLGRSAYSKWTIKKKEIVVTVG